MCNLDSISFGIEDTGDFWGTYPLDWSECAICEMRSGITFFLEAFSSAPVYCGKHDMPEHWRLEADDVPLSEHMHKLGSSIKMFDASPQGLEGHWKFYHSL